MISNIVMNIEVEDIGAVETLYENMISALKAGVESEL